MLASCGIKNCLRKLSLEPRQFSWSALSFSALSSAPLFPSRHSTRPVHASSFVFLRFYILHRVSFLLDLLRNRWSMKSSVYHVHVDGLIRMTISHLPKDLTSRMFEKAEVREVHRLSTTSLAFVTTCLSFSKQMLEPRASKSLLLSCEAVEGFEATSCTAATLVNSTLSGQKNPDFLGWASGFLSLSYRAFGSI
jgi:hypothetical protein